MEPLWIAHKKRRRQRCDDPKKNNMQTDREKIGGAVSQAHAKTTSPETGTISTADAHVLRSAAEVRKAAKDFLASGDRERTVLVRSDLRRSMGLRASAALGRRGRRKDTDADAVNPPPGVDYVCLGIGAVLTLRMATSDIVLTWVDLCDRTRKTFVEASGLVVPSVWSGDRMVPSVDANDLDAVEPFVHLRAKWMPLLARAIRAIGSERSLQSLHETVKTDVRAWIARNKKIAVWAAQEPITAPDLVAAPVRGGETPVYKHARFTRGHYAAQNTGRCFVSVDMRAASHAVLLVEGLIEAPSWRDLVVEATSAPGAASGAVATNADLLDYVSALKKLRASALAVGSGHGRQMALMAQTMARLFERLVDEGIVQRDDLAHFGRDELVFHVDGFDDAAHTIAAIGHAVKDDRWAPHFAYSAYRMEEVDREAIGYVLVHADGRWDLKCVDGAHAAAYARLWHRRVQETPGIGRS